MSAYNPLLNPSGSEKHVMNRLMGSMSAATFEMETFSRLAGIVMTTDVPTAAMECVHRPRLLMNPDFIFRHCQRDEHLFLLVMHELWHVMLAHTSLYPRVTQAQNIAFDAIINAGLMRQFRDPAYRGFFEALNPADKFPHLLLRPPVGWPDQPQYPANIGPPGTRRILRQLYPPRGAIRQTMPFYEEILDLIREDMRQKGQLIEVPFLLGDHDSRDPYKSRYLKDAMGRVAKKWPMTARQFGPPGQGGYLDDWQLDAQSTTQEIRRAFAGILRKALHSDMGAYRRKQRMPQRGISGKGVLPNPRDRLIHARRSLGTPGTLWEQQSTFKARVPEKKVRAHVYLDVSGSMSDVLPYLLNLLLPYVQSGKANVYQFSTEVDYLSARSLRKGILSSTGGTQINCVMQHIREQEQPLRRVLIVTDGYTGTPYPQDIKKLQDDGTQVYVVLPSESPYQDDLAPIARAFTILPPVH